MAINLDSEWRKAVKNLKSRINYFTDKQGLDRIDIDIEKPINVEQEDIDYLNNIRVKIQGKEKDDSMLYDIVYHGEFKYSQEERKRYSEKSFDFALQQLQIIFAELEEYGKIGHRLVVYIQMMYEYAHTTAEYRKKVIDIVEAFEGVGGATTFRSYLRTDPSKAAEMMSSDMLDYMRNAGVINEEQAEDLEQEVESEYTQAYEEATKKFEEDIALAEELKQARKKYPHSYGFYRDEDGKLKPIKPNIK